MFCFLYTRGWIAGDIDPAMDSMPSFCSAKKINTDRWVPRVGDQTQFFPHFLYFFFSFYFILNANITFIFLYPIYNLNAELDSRPT